MANVTGLERSKERATQQRLVGRVSNRFAGSMARLIRQDMERAADRLEREGAALIDAAARENAEEIEAELMREYAEAARLIGGRLLEAAAAKHGPAFIRKFEDDVAQEAADGWRAWAARHAISRAVGLAATTAQTVRAIVNRGEREGLGIEAMARAIRQAAPSVSRVRAAVIARTEAQSAGQAAQDIAARASRVVERREWVAGLDDRTRTFEDGDFSHEEADGEIVGLDEPFTRSGGALMHPGDPDGDPGNIIMCRCGVVYHV